MEVTSEGVGSIMEVADMESMNIDDNQTSQQPQESTMVTCCALFIKIKKKISLSWMNIIMIPGH